MSKLLKSLVWPAHKLSSKSLVWTPSEPHEVQDHGKSNFLEVWSKPKFDWFGSLISRCAIFRKS